MLCFIVKVNNWLEVENLITSGQYDIEIKEYLEEQISEFEHLTSDPIEYFEMQVNITEGDLYHIYPWETKTFDMWNKLHDEAYIKIRSLFSERIKTIYNSIKTEVILLENSCTVFGSDEKDLSIYVGKNLIMYDEHHGSSRLVKNADLKTLQSLDDEYTTIIPLPKEVI